MKRLFEDRSSQELIDLVKDLISKPQKLNNLTQELGVSKEEALASLALDLALRLETKIINIDLVMERIDNLAKIVDDAFKRASENLVESK